MSLILHPATGFPVGDPDRCPLEEDTLPSAAEIREALAPLILSASGWRKVFASPEPGDPRAPWAPAADAVGARTGPAGPDEDSLSPRVSPADLVLAGAAAMVFHDYLRERSGRADPAVLLGIDSRPTGPAIADAMARVLIGLGARPRYLFIVAAPEIMAYARTCAAKAADDEERAEGFAYVSASHNPPAHNGLKFGFGGGVLPGAEAARLIASFKTLVADPALPARVLALMEAADAKALARTYASVSAAKRRSVSAYTLFAREIVTGRSEPGAQEELLEEMAGTAARLPVGVVAELNGSARSLSIDADFLGGLGLAFEPRNASPRAFAHRIVPEGESLEPCRAELEAARARDPAFAAGYVPDCDGDRGNLVWYDERAGKARVLEAQEVFALACVAETAGLVRDGRLRLDDEGRPLDKAAIAVNDGTSLRIEALAKPFGVEVFRAETGEANVVGLAASLRSRGYAVRILGEGSNGGNITEPSEVRDPLATLGALLKLLLLRDSEKGEGLFRIWMRLSGRLAEYRPDFCLADVVASLPSFATTSAFEPRAALRIRSSDQAALKARYRDLFLAEWPGRRPELERRLGVVSWKALASNGSAEREIGDDFAASGRGGLKILLLDASGSPKAFLWMRGSGTEPVFRVMADAEGGRGRDPAEDEAYLLGWHTSMVRRADEA